MLKRLFGRKQLIPVVFLNGNINQEKANTMIHKLNKVSFTRSQCLALVVNIDFALPAQMDKIAESLKEIKQQHNLKIYGFAISRCKPQSYYLLSSCDKIYAAHSTVFNLRESSYRFTVRPFLQKFHIKKYTYLSDKNLKGSYFENGLSPMPFNIFTQKQGKLNKLVTECSFDNRLQVKESFERPSEIPYKMEESEALRIRLIDHIGNHYITLKNMFPRSKFIEITYEDQKWKIKEFLILLFLFKVFLKYLIVSYLYFTRVNKKKRKEQEHQTAHGGYKELDQPGSMHTLSG